MDFDTDNSLDTSSDFEGGSNPAWNEFYEAIPQDYHEVVTPLLKKWDSGVNERFQKIHNEYSDYKSFKENGYTAEQLDFAISLAQAIQEKPQDIWKALGDHHGYFDLDEEDQEDVDEYEGTTRDPRLASLEEGYNLLAEAFLKQEEERQHALEDEQLDSELNRLAREYGDFDEEYVLQTMVARECSAEDAVKAYTSFMERALTSRNRPAPKVFGSGGAAIPQMRKQELKTATDRKAAGVAYLQEFFNNR